MLFDEMKARFKYEEYEQTVAALQLERRVLKARGKKPGTHPATLAYRRVMHWLKRAWAAHTPVGTVRKSLLSR